MTDDFKEGMYAVGDAMSFGLGLIWIDADGRVSRVSIKDFLRCPHPNKQASTCGFESCPDCGARIEEE